MTRRDLAPGTFFTIDNPGSKSYESEWLHLDGRVFCVVDSHSEKDYFRGDEGSFQTVIGDVAPGIRVRVLHNLAYGQFD